MIDETALASVFAAIGEDGFQRVVAGFYRRVPNDDLLGPMYPPQDLAAAEQRLRDFLVYRFGGPDRYLPQRGHPRLRMRHAPFAIPTGARDRWVSLMDQSIAEANLPPATVEIMREFLHSTATMLINTTNDGG